MGVPGNANALLLRSAAAAGGYQVSRSLRFNSSDSAYLSRTPASAGNRKTWTWAGWVKRSALGNQTIVDVLDGQAGQPRGGIYFTSGDNLQITFNSSGASWDSNVVTTAVFRDVSAWYHLLIAFDVTQSTASDRVKVYVNGAQLTAFSTATYPTNTDQPINNTVQHRIGLLYGGTLGLNGYLAECYLIDGQQLTPSSFTEVSATTGQLIPKAYSGSYGTNGFHLPFSDNSTAAALGTDTSGNGNTWTVNNISILTGGPTSVASASGALPILNTSDTYGTTASGGIRSDSLAANIQLCLPFNSGSTTDVSPTGRVSSARTGTVSNVSSSSTSKFYGSSARFASGSINYGIVSAAAVNSTNNHTFEGWFRLDDVTPSCPLVTWYNYEDGWTEQGWAIRVFGSQVAVRNSTAGIQIVSKTITSNTWYHFAVTFQGVACKLYLDGELQSSIANFGTPGNTSNRLVVGGIFYYGAIQSPITGYLQDFRWYDYVKYTTSFNSPSATLNGGIAAGNDSLVDTPTSFGTDEQNGGEVRGNYATWNPLDKGSSVTLANGNLDFSQTATLGSCRGTIGVSSGKWYWEVSSPSSGSAIGIMKASANISDYVGGDANGWSYYANNGFKYNSNSGASYGATFGSGDVIGVAFDADAGTLTFYKNGTSQGQAYSGLTSGPYFPAFGNGSTSCSVNFGQRAFAYTAPSGFKALCDTNLTAPVVAKPSTVMDVLLWSGTGGNRSFSSLNMSPDFVWIKQRNQAFSTGHQLYDIVRGAGSEKELNSAGTAAEGAGNIDQYGWLSSFDSNGFSVTAGPLGADYVNASGTTYVAWTWDAGTSTVTNTQGSITSSVRANASAGFSVVTYTGNGATTTQTIGHGLNVSLGMVIVKARDSGSNDMGWGVSHTSVAAPNYLYLNRTDAAANAGPAQGQPSIGSGSTFSILAGTAPGTNNFNANGIKYVAYCFAPVTGYSSFGSYTGNGSADGPFVYTGFRPRWILFKCSSAVAYWGIYDAVRNTYNAVNLGLYPNDSIAEISDQPFDFLSNGFKVRGTTAFVNSNAATYVWAAFAESPFAYSRAR